MSERNMRNEDKRYWRSITEFVNADKPNAQSSSATQEFPENFDKPVGKGTPMTRRTFMGLLSASMAITATSCRKPDHKIISTRSSVEYLVPGLPNYYTSVFPFGTNPIGIVVKSREGRPVKIEGNDQHIASQGASSALMQASLLSLYDPDRMNGATVNNGYSTLDNALNKIADQLQKTIQEGKGVRIVHEEHASPSLKALTDSLQTSFPQVQFVQVSAFPAWNVAEANAAAFGIDAEFAIDFEKADVILAVDSDFLGTDKNAVYNTKQFSKRRKPTYENPDMSKLLVAEPTMTVTGINADHRARIAPAQIEAFLGAVLAEIGGSAQTVPANAETAAAAKEMAKHLIESGKQAVVTVGAHASVAAHSLAILINSRLNAYGEGKPINPMHQFAHSNSKKAAFEQFRTELSSGSIGTVIFADTNIFYYADSGLQKLLRQVPHKFTLSLTQDETALQSEIYVPTTHFLESWSDAVGFDGKISIQQPLIAPLNSASISVPDVILTLGKKLGAPGFEAENYRDFVRTRWEAEWDAAPVEAVLADEFERHWEAALRKGVYAAPSLTRVITWMPANEVALSEKIASGAQAGVPGSGMTLAVMPSNSLYDGKMTNNGWLLEVPDPVTKISWENVALISKNTADALGITLPALKDEQTEVVKVTTPAGTVELPAYIQPGMADNVVCIATGYGRTEGGKVLQNVGVNSFALKADFLGSPYVSATIEKTGSMRRIAMTQNHHSYEGRKIIQETTIQKVQAKEELFAAVKVPGRKEGEDRFTPPYSVMKDYQYRGHRWGMVIDLTACTGCNACVIACQAENNIPVVGKEQVIIGREMHWIRLDRYYAFKEGDTALANPEVVVQPMMCQHCENAPCENVCPVLATSHSPEGLNEMTYNRCVGTRYCLNNCPYKVRRFNYLKYHTDERTPLDMVFNPDVTVRMRGIMEKCTFCVQRITEAKHHAKDQGLSRVQDGMVVTACQQACPADAILFGDTNDENSKVAQTRKGERGYLVLEDLNVRPQVTYLAAVRNNA